MLKILSSDQVRDWDAFTISNEPIASIDLMERACRAFIVWFAERFNASRRIGVICGTGNNGGDGLGIARMLKEWGYTVRVWIVRGQGAGSPDFNTNLGRLGQTIPLTDVRQPGDPMDFDECDILIDGIFGSGLSRPAEGIYAYAIERINKTEATRVAIDIPSGLMVDQPSSGAIIRAHYTVTFQSPKLAFYLPGCYQFTGEWHVVDIGLAERFLDTVSTTTYQIQRKDIRRMRKRRSKFGHKGDYGRAVLIAGGYGKMGAAVLGARAALRSGLGLLTLHVPECGYAIVQTAVPEAMARVDAGAHAITEIPPIEADAVGIGPGIGTAEATASAFRRFLETHRRPMVIDADALNILSANAGMMELVPPLSILTPHPREFERLAGSWPDDFARLNLVREFARRHNIIMVLKGAYSTIASPDGNVYFNPTGNPGMATGGSGDVLTGILTGMLAQGYEPLEAAIMGVYLHGRAGDIAATEKGTEGLIASDLVAYLPQAFR
jgi:NAD(P)H-hydrate epimerase